jgi:perosamine synthetase
MFAPKRLDIEWADVIAALLGGVTAHARFDLAARVESRWSPAGDALVCLSVRTGLDLYLAAIDLPRGSEVLVSAITIPHMVRIIEDHGLVPVPVDLDMQELAVHGPALARALTPATRAILVAHLFGSRMPLDPILDVARSHGLLVIEDCAQAYTGPEYTGHREADISLFSFGTIKTATALGGALLRVRDRATLERMRRRHREYPGQAPAGYARRVLKGAFLKGLAGRAPYAAFVRGCRLAGIDHDALVHGAVRGFAGRCLRDEIRQQPAAALLALLERRLRRFDAARLAARTARGATLAHQLADAVEVPGRLSAAHSYWIFPIVAAEPDHVVVALRRAGFDATRRGSLVAVDPPPGREHLDPVEARRALARMVYVPVYPELSARALRRLTGVLRTSVLRDAERPAAEFLLGSQTTVQSEEYNGLRGLDTIPAVKDPVSSPAYPLNAGEGRVRVGSRPHDAGPT